MTAINQWQVGDFALADDDALGELVAVRIIKVQHDVITVEHPDGMEDHYAPADLIRPEQTGWPVE